MTRWLANRWLAGVVGLLLCGPVVPTSAAQPGAGRGSGEPSDLTVTGPVAGSRGIGDAYFPADGNGGYDVRHYDVRVRYDFARGHLRGRTVLTLVPDRALRRFNLDLLLEASRVRVDGHLARFRRDGTHELVVTPSRALRAGRAVKVEVSYAGFPGRHRYLGQSSWLADGQEVVTMNQPHMAPWWFPANDHPSDKATFRIAVTVPNGKQVVSNGRHLHTVTRGALRTWHWRARDPMATYLAFFAAGDFVLQQGRTAGLPWHNAVSERLPASTRRTSLRQLRRSAAVVRRLEKDLGPYPFETTGGVVTSLGAGFALENQTRPTYWPLTRDSTWLLVHELAHQWFGNDVAVLRWRDVWVNEGAATFMEQRHEELGGGRSVAAWLREEYEAYAPEDSFWTLRIGTPGAANLFEWPVYQRGAMTMQALRTRVGESAFWALLREWTSRHGDGNASSAQFEALAEEVSGVDLGAFFDAWLRTPSRPARTVANGLVPPTG